MDNRAWSSGASASPPAAPASPSVGYPTPGDPLTATPATKGGAFWFHQIGEELRAVLVAAGITPSTASTAQLLEAIQRLIDAQSGNYALDTGAANAYVVALSPAITAYTDGMTVRVKAVNANTGASTLNAGAGAVGLVNDVGGALGNGDIPAGGIFAATYIASAGKFYITSLVQSQVMTQAQGDARYAALGGDAAQDFISRNLLIGGILANAGVVGVGGDGAGGLFINGGSDGNVALGANGAARVTSTSVGLGVGKAPVCRFDVTDSVATRLANFDCTGANGVGVGLSNSGTDIGFIGSEKFIAGGVLGNFGIYATASLVLYGGGQITNKLTANSTGFEIVGAVKASIEGGSGALYPAYFCRSWVNLNGTGTVSIRGSGNVSSITDSGVGDYTVNFTTAMPHANYSMQGTGKRVGTPTPDGVVNMYTNIGSTSSVRVACSNGVGSYEDFDVVNIAVFC